MAKHSKPTEHYGKWRIRWTDERGFRRSLVFDRYKDAEYVLRKKLSEVEDVKRGLRSPTPQDKTFDELCSYWLENRTPLKRTPRDDLSLINSHLRPTFGKLNLKDLSIERVDQYVKDRKHLSHKTISNHLTHLIAMLNLAVDMEWLLKAPRIRKPKVRLFSSDYRFLRTKDEIVAF